VNAPRGNKVYVSEELLSCLGLRPGEKIVIGLGSGNFTAQVAQLAGKGCTIAIGQGNDPKATKIAWGKANVYLSPNGQLRIGPLVGFFLGRLKEQLQDELTYYRAIMNKARELGILAFIFAPDGIDWQQGLTYGYRSTGSKEEKWEPILLPLPDVIKSRFALLAEDEQQEAYARLLRLATNSKGRITICDYQGQGNRVELYQHLAGCHDLEAVLPAIRFPVSADNVAELLQDYSSVVLKPVNGSRGNCLLSVRDDGKYHCQYDLERLFALKERLINQSALAGFLAEVTGDTPYLAQAGVAGITKNGMPVTFSVYLHKDEKGQWQVAAALSMTVFPEAQAGAQMYGWGMDRADKLLVQLFPDRHELLLAKLKNAALDVARHLDAKPNHIYGELGLDLVLDKEDRVYVADITTEPLLLPLIQLGEVEKIAELILRYSFYAAKMPMESGVKAELASFQVLPEETE
jgi:hypothetical protein